MEERVEQLARGGDRRGVGLRGGRGWTRGGKDIYRQEVQTGERKERMTRSQLRDWLAKAKDASSRDLTV